MKHVGGLRGFFGWVFLCFVVGWLFHGLFFFGGCFFSFFECEGSAAKM